MKIRNGFVSNSSSSSFLIYGYAIDASTLADELGYNEDVDGDQEDFLYGKLDKSIPYQFGPYEIGEVYLGRSWSSVKDDETGAEFKARVKKEIEEFLGTEVECNTHSECWRDG